MDVFSAVLVVVGLSLFEGVSSLDNAIINAEVLRTMGEKARRWLPILFFHWRFPEPATFVLTVGRFAFWWRSVRAVRAAAAPGA